VKKQSRGSLVVVGVGFDGPPQTTAAAIACMEQADKLFYLVTAPLTVHWLKQLNDTATPLDDLYGKDKGRRQTYKEMTERILVSVREGLNVCAAFYGHPGVLALPPHAAVAQARKEGYPARMLPGISAEACLYADLGLNPGNNGVQNFEATDFLLARRRFDPTSELILWQMGVIGESKGKILQRGRQTERVQVLVDRLLRSYPPSHRVVLYIAATFAGAPPSVRRVALERLPRVQILPRTTVYIPALPARAVDRRILRWYSQ
jgi:uncharacterized protein YabN with tetrapyrrole methylase and pyrophosphatase domain